MKSQPYRPFPHPWSSSTVIILATFTPREPALAVELALEYVERRAPVQRRAAFHSRRLGIAQRRTAFHSRRLAHQLAHLEAHLDSYLGALEAATGCTDADAERLLAHWDALTAQYAALATTLTALTKSSPINNAQ